MKIIARIVIVVSIFMFGFVLGGRGEKPVVEENVCISPSLTVIEAKPVQLMLDFGDGKIETGTLDLSKDTTVYDFLESFTKENDIELKVKDYGGEMGVFVEAIGGIENNMSINKFWQYWVNNNYAQVGPGQQKLKSGDMVEWKFIQGQFNE